MSGQGCQEEQKQTLKFSPKVLCSCTTSFVYKKHVNNFDSGKFFSVQSTALIFNFGGDELTYRDMR